MPLPDASSSWSNANDSGRPAAPHDAPVPQDPRSRPPASSILPPVLPPIARVSSDRDLVFEVPATSRPASQGSRAPLGQTWSREESAGYFGNTALQNSPRSDARPGSSPTASSQTQSPDAHRSRRKPPPPPINTGSKMLSPPAQLTPPKSATSFVAPTDRQFPYTASSSVQGTSSEGPKGKKVQPFNTIKASFTKLLPMKKRKPRETPSAPQAPPLAPQPIMPDFRIRGTRVHDFNAPRPRRMLSTQEGLPPDPALLRDSTPHEPGAHAKRAHDSNPTWPRGIESSPNDALARAAHSTPTSTLDRVDSAGSHDSRRAPKEAWGSVHGPPESPPPVPVRKDSPREELPPVPPKDASPASVRTSTTSPSRAPSGIGSGSLGTRTSSKTLVSRNVSLATASTRRDTTVSAIPKHMVSTSSRFSFDISGAASQERRMEERYCQRAQDKQTADDAPCGPRDSRFDDLIDNDFDYEAVMDDDGLDMEEEVPLAGDFDDDIPGEMGGSGAAAPPPTVSQPLFQTTSAGAGPEHGPESFSGFNFQRSNPASSLASPLTPGVLPTPRDAEGIPIGFAMTKDTTPDVPSPHSPPLGDPPLPSSPGGGSGLTTRGLSVSPPLFQRQSPSQQEECGLGDDFDYDEGLADELDFVHEGPAFDESIFDNNDTDQYGRPIPGVFQKAHEAQRTMQQSVSNRSSDGTSHSAFESTAPTSLNTNLNPSVGPEKTEFDTHGPSLPHVLPVQDLAYQAALAEAAQQAAASGKFRRSSSPPLPAELTVTSPTDSHVSQYHDGFDALEDDLDDYEFDDDFIAEANASALANDQEGFYGQEFGFYSAPIAGRDYGSSSNGSGGALSAENLSQYANGGFFCSAPARTKSGRVASRDPNLTPITERSEYSNRNSIMSLAIPSGFDARSPTAQSPGLAQLAMSMSPEDMDPHKDMSEYLRARSRWLGGSQASLPSSREGSPRTEQVPLSVGGSTFGPSPWGPPSGSALGPAGAQPTGRRGSGMSIRSTSDALAGIGNALMSPMSAVSTLSLPVSPDGGQGLSPSPFLPPLALSGPISPGLLANKTTTKLCSPILEDGGCESHNLHDGTGKDANSVPMQTSSFPSTKPTPRPGVGHRHNGSADRISYTMEDEPESGGKIWVLERRRTADSGEVEVLGREVVENGRI